MSAVGSILTNTGALSALNSIAQTSQTTNQLQNELASGLAINSPSDNPAGYITAQGFTSQINGLTQATSNANQGVSLLQTAQSAIGQQIGVVQQLNSIAVQAANSTQTPSEVQSLQNLVGQLTGQVTTIAKQTQFNNINLLDGSFSNQQFQVGANEGQTLNLSISSTQASSLGMYLGQVSGGVYAASTGATVGGATISGTQANGSAGEIAQVVNSQTSITGVSAVTNGTNTQTYTAKDSTVAGAPASGISFTAMTLNNGTAADSVSVGAVTSVGALVAAVNAQTSLTGITASTVAGAADSFSLSQATGKNISFATGSANLSVGGGATAVTSVTAATGSNQRGAINLESASSFSFSGLEGASTAAGAVSFQSLNDINVTNASSAGVAIGVVKYALQSLNNQDGQLGASQQRLSATINNLSTTSSNAQTALGVVQDANIPAVANQLTQAQIQAQSGVAALKSSTQLQQTYLSLLP